MSRLRWPNSRHSLSDVPGTIHINTPGFVGGLEMPAQPLLEFRPVALHPSPDRRVVSLQAALLEELFDIAERE